jgi:hypothetical protein
MANALYPLWKEQLLQFTTNNNLSAGTVKVALIDTGVYTYSDAHQFFSSASSASIGTPQTIGPVKTFTGGVFDGPDVTFPSVTGNSVEALIIYIDTGTAGTSPLVAYIDTSVTGLPVTPNGGNIAITWNASGIFKL